MDMMISKIIKMRSMLLKMIVHKKTRKGRKRKKTGIDDGLSKEERKKIRHSREYLERVKERKRIKKQLYDLAIEEFQKYAQKFF